MSRVAPEHCRRAAGGPQHVSTGVCEINTRLFCIVLVYFFVRSFVVIFIHTPFRRAFARQSRCRNCSPAPDLALRRLIFPRVFFSGGTFFSQTPVSVAGRRMARSEPLEQADADILAPSRSNGETNRWGRKIRGRKERCAKTSENLLKPTKHTKRETGKNR